MPTRLHSPGCLVLGEWSHHHEYLGHENLFCTVLLCILSTSSYLLLLLGPYHFCPLLSPSCMKCSLGISNFLEELFSLSHSIVFLYFFTLITEKCFLISPCCSLELCIQMAYLSFSPLLLSSLLFTVICKGLLKQPFCFFAFLFLCYAYHLIHCRKLCFLCEYCPKI